MKQGATFPFVTLWHGSVEAWGWFLPQQRHDEADSRLRILALWTSGMRVYRSEYGLLAIAEQPLQCDCNSASAWPLARQGAGLASAPLPANIACRLSHSSVAIVWGGQLVQLDLGALAPVQPAHWLDLDDWQVVETPLPPRMAPAEIEHLGKPIHEILHTVPPGDDLDAIFAVKRRARVNLGRWWQYLNLPWDLLGKLLPVLRKSKQPKPTPLAEPSQALFSWVGIVTRVLLVLLGWVAIITLVTLLAQSYFSHSSTPLAQPNTVPPSVPPATQMPLTPPDGVTDYPATNNFHSGGVFWLLLWLTVGFGVARWLRQQLQAGDAALQRIGAQTRTSAPPRAAGLWSWLFGKSGKGQMSHPGAWQRLRSWLRRRDGAAGTVPATGMPPKAGPGRVGMWQRLRAWWRRGEGATGGSGANTTPPSPLSSKLMASQLGRLLEGRQARYMARLLAMFDDGDLDNALRYAVPLGGTAALVNPALGLPDPRRNLAITMRRALHGKNYNFGQQFFNHLQKLYRQSLEQLQRQGEIDRAAFVLAELLEDIPGAVKYLEAEGRLQQAAELADARGQDPVLSIRLFIKLGNGRRALAIAQQHDAYAAAIRLLETHDMSAEAGQLRGQYAMILAAGGAYEQALDTVLPVTRNIQQLRPLIQAGLAVPGKTQVRMLARYLLLDGDTADETLPLYQSWLQAPEAEAAALRQEFVKIFMEGKPQPELTALARNLLRDCARRLVMDFGAGQPGVNKSLIHSVLERCNDGALRADTPPLPAQAPAPAQPLAPPAEVLLDGGTGLPVHDAAFALDNAYVLALGEAGVEVVRTSLRGKHCLRRFAVAAQRLIMSDNGMRALAISVQAHYCSVSILALDSGKQQHYGNIAVDGFADSYDGRNWLVYQGRQLQLLDMLADTPRVLWGVNDLPGDIIAVERIGASFRLLLRSPQQQSADGLDELQYWVYVQNGSRLTCRDGRRFDRMRTLLLSIKRVAPAALYANPGPGTEFTLAVQHTEQNQSIYTLNTGNPPLTAVHQLDLLRNCEVMAASRGSDAVLLVLAYTQHLAQIRTSYLLPGARRCAFTPHLRRGSDILLWDDKGRLACIDLASGLVLAQFSA